MVGGNPDCAGGLEAADEVVDVGKVEKLFFCGDVFWARGRESKRGSNRRMNRGHFRAINLAASVRIIRTLVRFHRPIRSTAKRKYLLAHSIPIRLTSGRDFAWFTKKVPLPEPISMWTGAQRPKISRKLTLPARFWGSIMRLENFLMLLTLFETSQYKASFCNIFANMRLYYKGKGWFWQTLVYQGFRNGTMCS